MPFSPNEHYRSSLRRPMEGFDVWAIQIALNARGAHLTLDGVFGPSTQSAVRGEQVVLRVTVDGICGPETQSRMCVAACSKAQAHRTPGGLLKGICFGESGGIIPATTPAYPNGSRDYGPFQSNMTHPSQAELHEAFDPVASAREVAEGLQSSHAYFKEEAKRQREHGENPFVQTEEQAWRLAILAYNWPAAANAIGKGERDTWVYVESGSGVHRKLADPAPWVEAYHVPGVRSGDDWVRFYVNSKAVYVKDWSV